MLKGESETTFGLYWNSFYKILRKTITKNIHILIHVHPQKVDRVWWLWC